MGISGKALLIESKKLIVTPEPGDTVNSILEALWEMFADELYEQLPESVSSQEEADRIVNDRFHNEFLGWSFMGRLERGVEDLPTNPHYIFRDYISEYVSEKQEEVSSFFGDTDKDGYKGPSLPGGNFERKIQAFAWMKEEEFWGTEGYLVTTNHPTEDMFISWHFLPADKKHLAPEYAELKEVKVDDKGFLVGSRERILISELSQYNTQYKKV